jgi:hypothetical protein
MGGNADESDIFIPSRLVGGTWHQGTAKALQWDHLGFHISLLHSGFLAFKRLELTHGGNTMLHHTAHGS